MSQDSKVLSRSFVGIVVPLVGLISVAHQAMLPAL